MSQTTDTTTHEARLRAISERAKGLGFEMASAAYDAREDYDTERTMRRAFSELEQIGRMLNSAAIAQWGEPLCAGIDVRIPR